jgi:hypothetical protein
MGYMMIHPSLFHLETIHYRFNGALSLELSNDHPNMCVIHRKVALILGQWVSEVMALFSFLVENS